LRMLRAVRFATLLGFTIEPATAEAIRASAHLAAALSGERIQMELTKMLGAPKPAVALRMLSDLGLLEVICPELELCKTTPQDKAVAQDVFEHSLATVDAPPARGQHRERRALPAHVRARGALGARAGGDRGRGRVLAARSRGQRQRRHARARHRYRPRGRAGARRAL